MLTLRPDVSIQSLANCGVAATQRPRVPSDRVRDVDELVLDLEPLRDQRSQALDAEGLGRVVPGGDEVDPRLAGVAHHVLGGLAGDERVESQGGGLGERPRPPAGDDADRTDLRRPGVEGERLAADGRGDPRNQVSGGDRLGAAPDEADRPAPEGCERPLLGLEPERRAEQGVVADLTVGVEGEVIGGNGEVLAEGDAQASGELLAETAGERIAEEEAVVDEGEPGLRVARPLEKLTARGHPGHDPEHLGVPRDLEAVGAVVLERLRVEELVAEGDDLVAVSHAGRLYGKGGAFSARRRLYDEGAMSDATPSTEPRGEFIDSLMDTELYSIGAYFCDEHPDLVDEVVARSAEIEAQGLEAYAAARGGPVEEAFETLLTGLAVRYYKAVAG